MGNVRKAFTLIEILIVVVILGILAAIVVPQFASATKDAQIGNIKAQLGTLNRQLQLYQSKTNDTNAQVGAVFGATGTVIVNGSTEANDWTTFITGGYIKTSPRNPAYSGAGGSGSNTALEVGVGAAATRGTVDMGWHWNTVDGAIYASYYIEDTGLISPTGTL